MLRSIATVCVAGTLPEKLRAIAQAGFDGVEIFEPDFTAWAKARRASPRSARSWG